MMSADESAWHISETHFYDSESTSLSYYQDLNIFDEFSQNPISQELCTYICQK